MRSMVEGPAPRGWCRRIESAVPPWQRLTAVQPLRGEPPQGFGTGREVRLLAAPSVDLGEEDRLDAGSHELPRLRRPLFPGFHDISYCRPSSILISEDEPRGSGNFPPALTATTWLRGDHG